jgi:hypothetical protein
VIPTKQDNANATPMDQTCNMFGVLDNVAQLSPVVMCMSIPFAAKANRTQHAGPPEHDTLFHTTGNLKR